MPTNNVKHSDNYTTLNMDNEIKFPSRITLADYITTLTEEATKLGKKLEEVYVLSTGTGTCRDSNSKLEFCYLITIGDTPNEFFGKNLYVPIYKEE